MEEELVKPRVRHIAPHGGYYQITDVSYRGENHTYNLFENFTKDMCQNELAEFYENEKQKGNPHPMDSVLHFSLMDAAVRAGNSGLIRFIHDAINKYPITLSRVKYNSLDEELIHNYGTKEVYSFKRRFSGIDSNVINIEDKDIVSCFFGTSNVESINRASRLIFDNLPMHLITRPSILISTNTESTVYFCPNYYYHISLISGETGIHKSTALRALQVG